MGPLPSWVFQTSTYAIVRLSIWNYTLQGCMYHCLLDVPWMSHLYSESTSCPSRPTSILQAPSLAPRAAIINSSPKNVCPSLIWAPCHTVHWWAWLSSFDLFFHYIKLYQHCHCQLSSTTYFFLLSRMDSFYVLYWFTAWLSFNLFENFYLYRLEFREGVVAQWFMYAF